MARTGRPSRYCKQLADELCARISTGESLSSICKEEDKPGISSVMRWLFADGRDDFRAKYAQARKAQAEVWADEVIDISDDETIDVQRAKLMADNRKWVAARLLSKFKDRLDITSDDQPVKFTLALGEDSDSDGS